MPISKLPDRNSPEGQGIIDGYLAGKVEELWQQFGYGNKDVFVRAMRNTYGIRISEIPIRAKRIKEQREIVANAPLKLNVGTKPKTMAVINDTHNPYQDIRALSLVEQLLMEIQPDYLVYAGDLGDFYQISPFNKDPSRIGEMQEDVNDTKAMFRRHRKILPNAEMILLDGNHEDRWQKFLWTVASALSSLDCLTIPELYSLKEFGIEYIPYERGLMINDIFLVLHGTIASIHSGYTAKRMFEKHGGCGMCGHCHRGGSFYKRDRFGTWGWWENFCLCSLDPDWIMHPNWVQGFSLVHFAGNKRFWVEQIPITGHACMYGGRLYEA